MKIFLQFVMLMVIGGLAILLAIVLGDRGAWYLAWMLGTVVIVLVAAAAGLMLDTQDELTREGDLERPEPDRSRAAQH
ncbi:hypothetical protein EHZ19_29795 [Paraburkholderia bannensis]|nr:hypothetical protein [Paraburkholderia bannensis]RQM44209.1 hypothetical protein EHZ19_29795 [Paraburkholderia bannensis]